MLRDFVIDRHQSFTI